MNQIKFFLYAIFFIHFVILIYSFNKTTISSVFNSFEIKEANSILMENKDFLKEANIEKIIFKVDNYSGNAAGRAALRWSIHFQPKRDTFYLRSTAKKIDNTVAKFKNGEWKVYGDKNLKKMNKNEVLSLIESSIKDYLSKQKAYQNNINMWTKG